MLAFSVMIGDRVQDIFSQIQKHLFLEFNQSIPNTLSRCFNCSFSVESHSNLNCLQGSVEKKSGLWGRKQLRVLLCAWSTTLPCLILEGEGFSSNFENQSKIILWNFENVSLKLEGGDSG